MRDHVTFLSELFNKTEEKDNFFNPCCFGEDLAVWLIDRLVSNSGLQIDPEPCQEDWGWEILLSCDDKCFFIGIGQYELETELGWLCFIESRLPFYKKWFGVKDGDELAVVIEAVHSALISNLGNTQIRWHTRQNFEKGNENAWSESPNVE